MGGPVRSTSSNPLGIPAPYSFGPALPALGSGLGNAYAAANQALNDQRNQMLQNSASMFSQQTFGTTSLQQMLGQAQAMTPFTFAAASPGVLYLGPKVPQQTQYMLRSVKHLPNTLGWRYWLVDDDGCLISPAQKTRWETVDLRAERWSQEDAVRGVAGIHALLAPELWRELCFPYGEQQVTGIVERYGHYVLGEDGWRAEWVVIRELQAMDENTAGRLRAFYPELPVHVVGQPDKEQDNGYRKGYRDRREGGSDLPAGADDGSPAGA